MKVLFVILFNLLFSITVLAQETWIQLLDADDKSTLPFSSIEIGDKYVIADANGKASVPCPSKCKISYVGYESLVAQVQCIGDTLIFELKPASNLLNEAVVVGNTTGERIIESVAPLDVVGTSILKSRNVLSLENIIDRLPGVQIMDGQVSIRGGAGYAYGAGSRVAMVVNGIPAVQADVGSIAWNDLPLELLQSIELNKGSSSVLYGGAALNGVMQMNFWPKNQDHAQTTLETAVRLIDRPKDKQKKWYRNPPISSWSHITHISKNKPFRWMGSIRYENNQPHIQRHDEQRYRASFFSKYQVKPNLELGGHAIINRFSNSSSLYWENETVGAMIGDTSALVANEGIRVEVNPYLIYSDKNYNQHIIQSRVLFSDNQSIDNRDSRVEQYFLQYKHHSYLFNSRLKTIMGLQTQAFKSSAQLFGDRSFWSYNLAPYVQAEWKIHPKIQLQAGGRYEWNQQQAGQVVLSNDTLNGNQSEGRMLFSGGLNVEIADYTHVALSFGEGYRFPSIAEKFIVTQLGPTQISPNPELNSESGFSLNFSLKQGMKIGESEHLFRLDGFWYRYDEMIEFGIQNLALGFQALNIGDTEITGFEGAWFYQWKLGDFNWNGMCSYTYINPRYRNFSADIAARSSADENILKYRVRHQLSWQSMFEYESWQLGLGLLHNSNMVAIDGLLELFVVDGLETYREENQDGFWRWDFSLGYGLGSWSFMLDVQNFFNTEYSLRPGLLESPRNYTLRVNFKW